LTGETNDFVSVCVFALTEPASVTFLMPRRNHYNPKKWSWAESNRCPKHRL